MGAALRALYHARTRGDREAITGLLAWLQGSRNVDNAVKRVDAYVWWTENQAGAKLTAAMRLVNKGEEP